MNNECSKDSAEVHGAGGPLWGAAPCASADAADCNSGGGILNNIPLAISSTSLVSGGEDTVQMMLFVEWNPTFENLAKSLDELKELAKGEVEGLNYLKSGFDEWLVNPNGFQLGKGKGPKFRWRLAWGGVALGMQNRASVPVDAKIGNVWLIIGSEILMAVGGLKNVYAIVVEKLAALGGRILRHKLSRVDACVDLAGVAVTEFTKPFRDYRYVTRAQTGSEHFELEMKATIHRRGRRDTGFSIGTKIMLRIYDKLLEVKSQPSKQAIILERRWGNMPDKATRVEFELKREALKSFQIDTIEQWEEKKASVMKYLCDEWFRFVEKDGDRTNTSRMKVLKVWEVVAQRFADWTNAKPETKTAERFKADVVINPHALLLQAYGCIVAAVVALRTTGQTMNDVLAMGGAALAGVLKETDAQEKLRCKRLEFQALKPSFAFASVNAFGECSAP
jgi:hypothetical protein